MLLSRRPGRVRRHALCRRRLLQGLAEDAGQHRRAEADGAGARPRRRAHRRRSRSPQGLAGTRGFIADVYASVQGRRGGRQGPERGLQGHLREAQAQVRPLGHLRPLHALRRDARLRRGDAATPTRASGPPSATSRCGRRWKADRARASRHEPAGLRGGAATAARLPVAALRLPPPSPTRTRATPARHPVVVVGAGPVGLALAIDLAQREVPVRAARQRQHALDRLARHLLRQAHAGDLRPPRLRRPHGRQGRVVERRQGVLPATSRSTASTCCPRPATSGRPSSTCSSTTSRATWPSARRELPLIDLRWKQQGGRRRAARRPRDC